MVSSTPSSECKTLWVGDIQPNWDESFVGTLFASTVAAPGDVVDVKLIRDKQTGFPAGYGFVEFQSRAVAEKVLETCNGNPIPGTPFRFRLNWGSGGKRVDSTPEHSLFVGDLAPEVTDYMLQQLFAQSYPSTLGAKVVIDPATGMSKGFGFVRFGKEEERDEALANMTGTMCGSRAIRVAPATAKKTASGGDATNTTVFVGGIDASVTEEVLREHFSQFGEIVYVKIPTGRGCGFVQYVQRASAEAAIAKMQGGNVNGCKVRLSWGRTSPAKAREAYPPAAYPSTSGTTTGSTAGAGGGYGAYQYQQYYGQQAAPYGTTGGYPGYPQQYPPPPPMYSAPPHPMAAYHYAGPGYPPAPPTYSAYPPPGPMDMSVPMGQQGYSNPPMGHAGGVDDRGVSGSSAAPYGGSYYDSRGSAGPDMVSGGRGAGGARGPQHGGYQSKGGGVKNLTSRLEQLDLSGGAGAGAGAKGGGGYRGAYQGGGAGGRGYGGGTPSGAQHHR